MKLSSNNNNAVLGLLSVLLAFPTMVTAARTGVTGESGAWGVISRRLADCAKDDFLVTGFVVSEGGSNTTEAGYVGCYEVADTLDGDNFYKIDGDLEAAGGAFYPSDNNGGNTVASWYFGVVASNTTAEEASDSFLCFDLDLNPTDTHPADVVSWGLLRDEDSSAVRTCDIEITCGCSLEPDTPAPSVVEEEDDDTPLEATEGDAAFAMAVGGTQFVLVLSTVVLVAANLL